MAAQLEHENMGVRQAAVDVLRALVIAKEHAGAIVPRLEDREGDVRWAVVQAYKSGA